MRPGLRLVSMFCALALAARADAATFGHDAYSPVVVTPLGFGVDIGGAVPDGSGGMLVTWVSGPYDIYLQRYTGTGAVAPGWPANGLVVCNASGTQSHPALVGDGAGGAIVAWEDSRGANSDIYATHVQANGTISGWPANGLLVSTTFSSSSLPDYQPRLTTDGTGGAFIAWVLQFSGTDDDVYAAHVTSAGALPWSFALYSPVGQQDIRHVIPDGSGGFFVNFSDNENGSYTHQKVQHYTAAGAATWSYLRLGTGSTAYNQYESDIVGDGSGGLYGVCGDDAFGVTMLTVNHFIANGTGDPNWGGINAYKVLASNGTFAQGSPVALADGAGGLLAFFDDQRYGYPSAFAQRIGPYGFPYSGWPTGGVSLSTGSGNHWPMSAVSDGAGGGIVVWLDNRYADYLLYASRVLGNGSVAPGWAYGGTPVDLGGLMNIGVGFPATVSDGNSGALFAWADTRGATNYGYMGVYAQNLDRFGAYGDARPAITKVADVPNDQGGQLSVQWSASYLDADPSRTVTQYSIWRRVPGGTVAAAAPAGMPSARPIRTTIEAGQVLYWEYVATEPARMQAGYSAVVSTTSDSTPSANPRTSLMVMAEAPGAVEFWASKPDSGYSVDNLVPPAPSPFAGTYASGTTSMHWAPVIVPDLANYRLYRGNSASFVPSSSNRIGSPVDTAYVDVANGAFYYRVSAVDVHGNEGPSTLLLPAGTTGVAGGSLPMAVELAPPAPNPARGSTALAYALPRDGTARLALYDVSGRRVRVLVDGPVAAGEHVAAWDLRDDAGRALAAGLYFARLEAGGRTLTRSVLAMR